MASARRSRGAALVAATTGAGWVVTGAADFAIWTLVVLLRGCKLPCWLPATTSRSRGGSTVRFPTTAAGGAGAAATVGWLMLLATSWCTTCAGAAAVAAFIVAGCAGAWAGVGIGVAV